MFFCKDENLMALKWIDKNCVHMISSHINSNVGTVERRNKGQAEKIKVNCPGVVKDYNKNMGE